MARTPKVVEDRREQIIESAIIVFAEKGFDRATNKDIADHAGITPGLIYHYFKSKEDLLRTAIEEYSPLRLVQDIPSEMLELPPATLLPLIIQQALTIVEDEHFVRLMRIFLSASLHNLEISSMNFSAMQKVLSFLERYLAAKMDSGELHRSNPSLAAQIFGGTIMALVIRRQLLRDPIALQYSHEQMVESISAVVLRGLLVP